MIRPAYLLFVVATLGIACASPSSTTVADRAHTIEGQVWSPYCPGRLLIDCTTPQARQLRVQIERRLERGDSMEAVLEWIRRDHGDEALARPQAKGAGLALWLLPAALFVAGSIVVAGLIRRWTHNRAPAPDDQRDGNARIREEVQGDL